MSSNNSRHVHTITQSFQLISKQNISRTHQGAALIEICFAIPVLAIIIFGFFNVMETYSTTIPVSNASYQLALVGSEYLPEEGNSKINDRAMRLVTQTNSPLNAVKPETFTVLSEYDEENGLLRVKSAGKAGHGMASVTNLGSSYEVVAPILAKRIATTTSNSFNSDPLCPSGYGCDLTCSGYSDCTPPNNNTPPSTSAQGTVTNTDDDGNVVVTKNSPNYEEFAEYESRISNQQELQQGSFELYR